MPPPTTEPREMEEASQNPTDRTEASSQDSDTAQETSEYSVWWKDPDGKDPENPMNWSARRKWSIIGVLSLLTFLT